MALLGCTGWLCLAALDGNIPDEHLRAHPAPDSNMKAAQVIINQSIPSASVLPFLFSSKP